MTRTPGHSGPDAADKAEDFRQDQDPEEFALYVHWPYCAAKCPYCDFNSHVPPGGLDFGDAGYARWRDAYVSEIKRASDPESGIPSGRILGSIFFGGGTPSLMDPDVVATVIDSARAAWTSSPNIEITLEANPGSVETSRLAAMRDAGVNRVSIGIQALDDSSLRRLGRLHSAREAREAFEVARNLFERSSFDLIYARQGQRPDDWERELREALELAGSHLSLYQLTIEANTAFGKRHKRGRLPGLPDEDRAAEMFEITDNMCADAGLPRYEVSNHAVPGQECRHNLLYWRCGDYLGIGPGAHGRVTTRNGRFATECARDPADWLDRVRRGGAETVRSRLTRREQAEELLMMGLRLREGASMERYERLAGESLPDSAIRDLEDRDLVQRCGSRLRATRRGTALLDSVLLELLSSAD